MSNRISCSCLGLLTSDSRNSRSPVLQVICDLEKQQTKLQASSATKMEEMRKDILAALPTLATHASVKDTALNQLALKLEALVELAGKMERQHKVLESLMFSSMKVREEEIKKPHKLTLAWIFDHDKTILVQWLKEGNGIFWMKGKVCIVFRTKTCRQYETCGTSRNIFFQSLDEDHEYMSVFLAWL